MSIGCLSLSFRHLQFLSSVYTVSRVQVFHTLDPVLKKLSVLYFASTSPNLGNLQERPSLSFHNQVWQAGNSLKWLKIKCIKVTAMTSHLTSVRMAQFQHTGNNKGCSGSGEKQNNPCALVMGCKLVSPKRKPVWRGLNKLKMQIP